MPNDSDSARLLALETEHKNLKEAVAEKFTSERDVTTLTINALVSRVNAVEEEMVAFSMATEGMKENIQFLVDAERDRTTRETLEKEYKEKDEKKDEKSFFTKFKDKLAEYAAMALAVTVLAIVIYIFANAKPIGLTG